MMQGLLKPYKNVAVEKQQRDAANKSNASEPLSVQSGISSDGTHSSAGAAHQDSSSTQATSSGELSPPTLLHIRKPFCQPEPRIKDRKEREKAERAMPVPVSSSPSLAHRTFLGTAYLGFNKNHTGAPNNLHPVQNVKDKEVHALYEGQVMTEIAATVKKPDNVSENLWLANNFVKILKEVSMVSSFMLAGCCTEASCPVMRAGTHTYLWQDHHQDGSTTSGVELSAPKYIKAVLDTAQNMINDSRVFPRESGRPFPECFKELVVPQFRRFFRCYCHFYRHHFKQMEELGIEKRVRFCAAFCTMFCKEFNICASTEYDTIDTMIEQWLDELDSENQTGSISCKTIPTRPELSCRFAMTGTIVMRISMRGICISSRVAVAFVMP
ncbi:unnamed protein product [Amoebophrya sp. A120]|nr:unnamed protein product [Amoebophrya sp. A120]|eukprot:GSA120T00000174001.1